MNNSSWMVTGVTGLLGANAAITLSKSENVVGVGRKAPVGIPIDFVAADFSAEVDINFLLQRTVPKVILHCAALSTHEECESNPALAHQINVVASRELARMARRIGAKFIYISTDAVFNGKEGNYSEEHPTSPTTIYGRTKLAGEYAVLEENPDALVARVNFYGWSPSGRRSLAEYFFNRLSQMEHAPGFVDVTVSTMYVGTLIDRIQRLVEAEASGVFNVVNDEATTKFEFGQKIARHMNLNPNLVPPSKSSELVDIPRGFDTTLNTSKLKRLIQTSSDQESDVVSFFDNFESGIRQQLKSFFLSQEK